MGNLPPMQAFKMHWSGYYACKCQTVSIGLADLNLDGMTHLLDGSRSQSPEALSLRCIHQMSWRSGR